MTTTIEASGIQLKRILLASDLSPASSAALPYAAALTRRFGAILYVAHIVPTDAFTTIPPDERDAALLRISASVEQQLAGLRETAILTDVPHEILIDHGDTWPMLSMMVERHKVDLIVIGTHGRRGVQKLLLGSVAEEILRLAPIPVLMVGPSCTADGGQFHGILYGTDFSLESEAAMHYAYALASEYGASLTFFHVAEDVWKEPLSTRMAPAEFFELRMMEQHWPLAEHEIEPEFRVDFGPPAERILETAKKQQIDLIVLGVRGVAHPYLAAHLPGPTAYDVVSNARCPVLVVRGPSAREKRA